MWRGGGPLPPGPPAPAAAGVAARTPDSVTANSAALARFAAVVLAYPLRDATLQVSSGGFSRADNVTVTSEALVAVGWAGLVLPHQLEVRSRPVARLEPWRTRRTAAFSKRTRVRAGPSS